MLLADDDKEVVQLAWHALESTTASVPKEALPTLVRLPRPGYQGIA